MQITAAGGPSWALLCEPLDPGVAGAERAEHGGQPWQSLPALGSNTTARDLGAAIFGALR